MGYNRGGVMGWLDGLGTQVGDILQEGLGVFAEGGINRLRDQPTPVPDETPVPSDAQGADGSISFSPITYVAGLPLPVKIGLGLGIAYVAYRVVK